MFGKWTHIFSLLPVLLTFLTSGWHGVGAIKVYTSGHVDAVNGTDVRLKCTFSSSYPVRRSSLTISWSFRPLRAGDEETEALSIKQEYPGQGANQIKAPPDTASHVCVDIWLADSTSEIQTQVSKVFYYHEKPFLPTEGHFQNKVEFVGEISSSDASITVRDVKFSYNGTFSCQVKNPPDVHGNVGKVQLRVVTSAPLSEIVILAVAIGGAVLLAIVIFAISTFVRRRRTSERLERERLQHQRKDLVVW